jgi:HTH-type transcriptional repressor of NAD biosynthesis genes
MEKRFKNGLVLGKLMPVHNGHLFLINEAIKQCETVHVMVCSRLCEPIDGKLRFGWVDAIYKDNNNVNVIHCPDENPQYPEDDENFWEIWHDSVYSYIPELDAVFASEDYVVPFAECLKVTPILVDQNRDAVPVSGTDIRQNPFKNWDFIPDEVKSYFNLKIAIVGPESSGKSTLVKQLADLYDGTTVAEYGREYCETKSTTDLLPFDFYKIAREQWVRNKEAGESSDKKYLFMDTEAIVTKTFLKMYGTLNGWFYSGKKIGHWINAIDQIIRVQVFEYDLYIITYPDLEWEDDGSRDFNDKKDRLNSFATIKGELIGNGANYAVLMGKREQRLKNAITIIEEKQKELWEKPWEKISFER